MPPQESTGKVEVGVYQVDEMLDDDDDDDDHWVPRHAWASNRIKSGPPSAAQLKVLAERDQGAAQQLALHQQQFAESKMVQRGWKKKNTAKWVAGGAQAGIGATGMVNTAVGGAVLGGATLGTTTGWAAVAAGGLALGAGPIGLLAAGTAMSLGGSVRQGVATYKTHQHIKMLDSILFLAKQGHFHCEATNDPNHNDIIVKVLPYIIAKKKKKRIRKAARTIPVLGSIETARSALKKIEKWELGTLGKARKWHAHQLAVHHCDTDCHLTKAIIAELFSVDEMVAEQARYCDDVMLGKLLEKKMKSV